MPPLVPNFKDKQSQPLRCSCVLACVCLCCVSLFCCVSHSFAPKNFVFVYPKLPLWFYHICLYHDNVIFGFALFKLYMNGMILLKIVYLLQNNDWYKLTRVAEMHWFSGLNLAYCMNTPTVSSAGHLGCFKFLQLQTLQMQTFLVHMCESFLGMCLGVAQVLKYTR